ncbi:hypothetical protein BDN70DRAFT_926055 [Pholiota conissans]|uniref:F-box domain-containing protein n=1 Tax=Pholiota conissans TaxID=109636 RepID=A0A9P6CLX5_9AGAR|nr:hypothetical protein BDN70DRAFT_926055 [Pholiota conissans]
MTRPSTTHTNSTGHAERAEFTTPYTCPSLHSLPLDVLPSIFTQLADQRDWAAAALVSRAFNRHATPFLYRTLDSRVISKTFIHHPSTTLLARPELARYVRHVTETGAIHRGMLPHHPNITQHTIAALALCINLQSLTWIDDASSPHTSSSPNASLTSSPSPSPHTATTVSTTTNTKITTLTPLLPLLLHTVRALPHRPLRELTIRTHNALGDEVWCMIGAMRGLVRVRVWCMEGPPRGVGMGTERGLEVGKTLRALELGVSSFGYAVVELLAQLPFLQDLRLKGTPASSIPQILALLPSLRTLDTEYMVFSGGDKSQSQHRGHDRTLTDTSLIQRNSENDNSSGPALQHLTVRTSAGDALGVQMMWTWILDELVRQAGLETFRLHAYAYSSLSYVGFRRGSGSVPPLHAYASPTTTSNANANSNSNSNPTPNPNTLQAKEQDTTPDALGHGIAIPRCFLLDMAARHGTTLRAFAVSEARMALVDVRYACRVFERLEVFGCALSSPDVDSIMDAIAPAKYLHTLKLHVQWIKSDCDDRDDDYNDGYDNTNISDEDTTTSESNDDALPTANSNYNTNPRESDSKGSNWPPHPQNEYFTLSDARRMMHKTRLRFISIGHVQYMGKWVLRETLKPGGCNYELAGSEVDRGGEEDGRGSEVAFVVEVGLAEERWKT